MRSRVALDKPHINQTHLRNFRIIYAGKANHVISSKFNDKQKKIVSSHNEKSKVIPLQLVTCTSKDNKLDVLQSQLSIMTVLPHTSNMPIG